MVEGKLKLWIRGGKFECRSDLYIKVFCDGREFWKTDEIDGYTPQWDSTCIKNVKGPYEKITFNLMDEDTFSRDDLLATCELPFSAIESGASFMGELDMKDGDGKIIGQLDVNVEFEPGDVSTFDLMESRLHTSDE